jgi:hypothetical protein
MPSMCNPLLGGDARSVVSNSMELPLRLKAIGLEEALTKCVSAACCFASVSTHRLAFT